ncbi:hypothetical protein EV700_1536 [Fluviicoccus keumensis]|uniref:Uncharacterized protein n=1 Tax=Fluviicoccus keumensis TaxID=1435465 RepID=A0A4Q7ZAJ3_9GAMM|nr:hypothetical protein [Fluviicoccus keumensis]RZU47144.1 hypothetical protein EV700_1536 [Fluviicoccus keumensis]
MRPRIDNVDFAVDEHIWGHRLYDEQLPHLTVLEFLGVLGSNRDTPLVAEPTDKVRYRPQRQIRLRGLLFNNPYVETVRERPIPDEEKWRVWSEHFAKGATKLGDEDMDYLRQVFTKFDDFAKAIELLRSSSFEARSNKRWSSKFVFPFGPDALYEDLRVDSNGGATNDRRFFARTGELLYLMLCRATRGPELGLKLVDRLFDRQAPMNRLVKALQGEIQLAESARDVGYLPYAKHPRFDRLCDDWLAILSRDMPIYDALEHLITITGLNQLLYFLECAKTQSGDVEPVEFVCEIVSKERTKVRALSGDSYQSNQAASLRAVKAAVEGIRLTDEWADALKSDYPDSECAKLMHAVFQWPTADEEDDGGVGSTSGDELVRKLVEKAESRHGQHIGKIHAAWSKAIGLSSRRLARRTRYAPNDRLLKTLVVTIVNDRMQFDEFLHEVHARYGLVIGDAEGIRLVHEKQVDQEALSENRGSLETRLVGLGLVRRLSDSCSFVENPFSSEGVM